MKFEGGKGEKKNEGGKKNTTPVRWEVFFHQNLNVGKRGRRLLSTSEKTSPFFSGGKRREKEKGGFARRRTRMNKENKRPYRGIEGEGSSGVDKGTENSTIGRREVKPITQRSYTHICRRGGRRKEGKKKILSRCGKSLLLRGGDKGPVRERQRQLTASR